MGTEGLVTRFVLRIARRGAIVWAAVVFVSVAISIKSFDSIYPNLADRQKLATSLEANTGFAALLGVPRHIETTGGFIAWRIGVLLAVILSIWALLLASRVLRGEEDAGRWETLAGAPRSTPALTGAVVAALALTCLAPFLGGVLGAFTAISGTGMSAADVCWFMLGLAFCALAFATFAAFASQLFAPRARVSTVAAIALGVAYLVRLVADSETQFAWLRWCSPLGWLEELHAFTGTRPAVLLLYVAWALFFSGAAVVLAQRRDVGGAIFATEGARHSRSLHFGNPFIDAFRFLRGSVIGWTAGASIAAFAMGLLAPSAAKAIRESDFANRFGGALGGNIGTAAGYLGATFVFAIAVLVAISPSSHVASVRDEEESGRIETFLAGLTSRRTWLWSRAAVAVANALLIAVGAALLAWLGVRIAGESIGIEHLLAATLCYVPLAIAFGGVALAVFGVAPRATQGLVATLVGVAALIELLGSLLDAPSWFLDLSPFFHLGNAPAEPARPIPALVMFAIGAACAVFGVEAFARRDLSPM
jgi:ABC-2 type transport system permease protein